MRFQLGLCFFIMQMLNKGACCMFWCQEHRINPFKNQFIQCLPAISSSEFALMSSITVPFMMQLRSSKRLCRDRVATQGLLHRSPPSSTSSSNLSHLQQKEDTHKKNSSILPCIFLLVLMCTLCCITLLTHSGLVTSFNKLLFRQKQFKVSSTTGEKKYKGVPCCLLPFSILTLPEADFIQLSEQGVGDVFLIAILSPQQKLHPLSWCVCYSKFDRWNTSTEKKKKPSKLRICIPLEDMDQKHITQVL